MLKRRILSLFLLIAMISGLLGFSVAMDAASVSYRYRGDMDADGKFLLADVIAVARFVLEEDPAADEITKQVADVNRDGKTGLADVIILAKYVAGVGYRPAMLPVEYELIDDTPSVRLLYNDQRPVSVQDFGVDQVIGLRFYATAPFDGLDIQMNGGGSAEFALYEWHESTPVSRMSEPLWKEERTFEQLAKVELRFSEKPVYEYLLCITELSGEISIQVCDGAAAEKRSVLYVDGRQLSRSGLAQIHYTKNPVENSGGLTTREDITYVWPDAEEPEDFEVLTVRDAMPDTWVATDGLDRTLSENEQVGDVKEDKYVGIFYWDWHVSQSYNPYSMTNNHELLIGATGEKYAQTDWLASNLAGNHFWGESIFGYYKTDEDWVLRKHAELLAAAGIDFIAFDNTNGTLTFKESYEHIFKVFDDARRDGVKTPKITFMLPFGGGNNSCEQIKQLYYDIYQKGRYQDLWFYWEGKPFLMAHGDSVTADRAPEGRVIKEFFTFRGPVASYHGASGQYWSWCNIYPQVPCYNEDGTVEQVAVSVAQNYDPDSQSTSTMSNPKSFNRAYTKENGYSENPETDMLYGLNFAEQFEYALSLDPEVIFITGWNEWIVGNQSGHFTDQFTPLASRDIEPSKGVLKDHYYYQMVEFIRQFKGVRSVPEATAEKTIDIYAAQDQWNDVGPNYIAYADNVDHRDGYGYYDANSFVEGVGGTQRVHYVNTTGRNDIVNAKVARDTEYLYFMVETAEDLTAATDPSWMQLFLDIGDSEENWETFEYIVNRTSPGEKAILERSTGGWNWETVGQISYSVQGNRLQLQIPKSLLGIESDSFTINFKWADNTQVDGDIMDFYANGDVAPLGRFKYQYQA